MTDSLRLLAQVAHNQAESSAQDLENVADQQETNLKKKEQLRDTEKLYDSVMADGVITFDELVTLHEMRQFVGTTDESFWNAQGHVAGFESAYDGQWKYDEAKVGTDEKHGKNSHWYMDTNSNDPGAAEVKSLMENIKSEITGAKEKVDDDQSQVQFKIQVGTSDLQNAENVQSQAEKRLETQRKDLTRNWGG